MTERERSTIVRRLASTASELLMLSAAYGSPFFHWPGHTPGPVPLQESTETDQHDHFIGLIPLLKHTVVYTTVAAVLFVTSSMMYAMFYFAVMPAPDVMVPLYFDYSGISRHPAASLIPTATKICPSLDTINTDVSNEACTDQEELTEELPASLSKEKQEFVDHAPWAAADLFAKHMQWEFFEDEIVPPPRYKSHALKVRQAHYMEVHLELPQSEQNRRAGLFGVMVELQSGDGIKLAASMRTTRLPHESNWLSVIRKLILLIPLLIGAIPESRTVVIPSFHHVVETSKHPIRFVTVRILHSGTNREQYQHHQQHYNSNYNSNYDHIHPVEVTAGHIQIGRELQRHQTILKQWFYTCYMVGTLLFFTTQMIGLAIGKYVWDRRTQHTEQNQNGDAQWEDPSVELRMDGSQVGEDDDGPWESTINQIANDLQVAHRDEASAALHRNASNNTPDTQHGVNPAVVVDE